MKKFVKLTLVVSLIAGGMLISSCSSSPSEEELQQLNSLKAQVSALENQIKEKKSEKASIEKQVAEKNGRLQQCQSDQEAVKKGLGQ
jgi:outer membrane murein-binding lipoprotein Lpp